MCSELFRIPVELSGVPFLGFGLLLAVWLVGWGVVLARLYTRDGTNGDFWGWVPTAVIGLVAIAATTWLAPQGVPIRGYGVMLLIAISTGVAMAVHRARRHGIEADKIFSLVFWLFVAGIAGARAFFVIEYWETGRFAGKTVLHTIFKILQFTEGGLVVYGSVIGGLLAFLWFVRRNKLPMLGMADILAPCFLVGLAIGRVGCLLNGCCYGGVCDLPWAVTFPTDSPPFVDQLIHGELHGLQLVENEAGRLMLVTEGEPRAVASINGVPASSTNDAAGVLGTAYGAGDSVAVGLVGGETVTVPAIPIGRSLPVHPTQLYSTVNAALTAWLLWSWFPHRRRDGEVALLMFTLYPVSRFLLEAIRTDESAIFGTGLSISQNVSLGILTLAVVGWVVLSRTPRGRRLAEVLTPMGRTAAAGAA